MVKRRAGCRARVNRSAALVNEDLSGVGAGMVVQMEACAMRGTSTPTPALRDDPPHKEEGNCIGPPHHPIGNSVVDLIFSIANRDVTFLSGTVAIRRL